MLPRRGRSRRFEESRAPDSDEDVHRVDDVTRSGKDIEFMKWLRPDLYRMVLSGSPGTFMEAVNNVVDIEESLMDTDAPVQQTTGRASRPVQAVSQSYQSPQGSQQSSHHQFRPRGKQFKKKGNSSSSGSVSSGSGSGSVTTRTFLRRI
ncbi:hypothetical protein F511_16894 [Dorcoceras hygrometricum]|uniref:Uncharacterized protein n=1 Tax=Dorcoceras hygrometricum TaxID=472368 RepID=A0A2Z7CQP4_9LAMI|nr:hypothetical protein F511_16894 [Dorcoceras hygrometricum]